MGLERKINRGKTILDFLSPERKTEAEKLIAKGMSLEDACTRMGLVFCRRGTRR